MRRVGLRLSDTLKWKLPIGCTNKSIVFSKEARVRISLLSLFNFLVSYRTPYSICLTKKSLILDPPQTITPCSRVTKSGTVESTIKIESWISGSPSCPGQSRNPGMNFSPNVVCVDISGFCGASGISDGAKAASYLNLQCSFDHQGSSLCPGRFCKSSQNV
jgi:hypothetical protein